MEIKRVYIAHLRVVSGLFEGFAQFLYAEMCSTVGAVIFSRGADRDAGDKIFAAQLVTARAVGEAIGQHAVKVLFEDGGNVVPVERKLEKHRVMAQQGLLFGGGVNAVIGIQRGQIADFQRKAAVLQSRDDGFVGNGPAEIGMG